ncbi:MAG: hypothetical protein ACXQS8_00520, partial [Candidatus Helarchaeales archaeon]
RLDFAYLGAACLISPMERRLLMNLEYWKPPMKQDLLQNLREKDLSKTLGFLAFMDKFLDLKKLSSSESRIILNLMIEQKEDSNDRRAERFFSIVEPRDEFSRDVFLAKRILFRFIQNDELKEYKETIGPFSKACLNLASLKIFQFHEELNKLPDVPKGLARLIQESLKRVKPVTIRRKIFRKDETKVELEVEITNHSDLILIPLKIKNLIPTEIEYKGSIYFEKLYPESTIKQNIEILIQDGQSIKLEPLVLVLKDDLDNKYHVRSDPIKLD